jgi:hypothetical protein
MSYSPGSDINAPMIGPWTERHSAIANERILSSPPSSATYTSANRAFYYPVLVFGTCVIYRTWWVNGATTTDGATIEVGVYADNGAKPGAKLISGSATQGTANELQFVDVAATVLTAGRYWVAVVSSSATNTTLFRLAAPSAATDAVLMFEQATASPLPATATPVEANFSVIYVCGFATTASP